MANVHAVMAGLPQFLLDEGWLQPDEVWLLDSSYDHSGKGLDWTENEQGYYWVDDTGHHHGYTGEPEGHTLHHTASTGYTPNVKNSKEQTKANTYAGLRRGDRLYQSGGGQPCIAFASAGPADYSAGSGVKKLLTDFLAPGLRFIGKQTSNDDYPKWYGNRYYWGTEVVLNGTGAVLDAGVRDLLVRFCAGMSVYLDRNAWFHFGHGQHSRRKIDLWDGRYSDMAETIFTIQADVAVLLLTDTVPPVEPPPIEPPEEYMYVEVEYTDGFNSNPEKRAAVAGFQGSMKIKGFDDDNSQSVDGVDGKYGRGTERACKAFQASVGLPVTGKGDMATRAAAEV